MEFLKNVVFIKSIFEYKELPTEDLPQVVFVGKSNVGKSSFINTITNNKKMAKVGNTPGKTKCINQFIVDGKLTMCDLPGYGYSTMSRSEKENINKLVDRFMNNNDKIKQVFFLVDIRHKPSKEDRHMYEWILGQELPFTIIANKADKIAKTKIPAYIDVIRKELFAKEEIIPFSTQTKLGLDIVIKKILEQYN
ncbi:MAG: ribosome biogenesis GTP-binding protein YihA/YsxC [Clostridia bacterium]